MSDNTEDRGQFSPITADAIADMAYGVADSMIKARNERIENEMVNEEKISPRCMFDPDGVGYCYHCFEIGGCHAMGGPLQKPTSKEGELDRTE